MDPGLKVAEVRVRARVVYIAVFAGGIPATALLLVLAAVLGRGRHDFGYLNFPIALALFVPVGVAHELLHALAALVYGRLRPRDLSLAVLWRAGNLVCHIKVPLPVRTMRLVGLAPLVVTGPVTLGLLLVYPSEVTALVAAFAIFGCLMDVIMVHRLSRFRGDLLVVDHPSEPGFDIYAPEGSTQR